MSNLNIILDKIKITTHSMAMKFAGEVKQTEIEMIEERVYDYYDAIRSGVVLNPYQRTGELVNNIRIEHSGRFYSIINYAYEGTDRLYNIERGVVTWQNSMLNFINSKREFMAPTIEEMNTKLNSMVIEEFMGTGLQIKKRR